MARQDRKSHAQWMAQAAACRRTFAATHDKFWAVAVRSAVGVARSHREA